MVPSFIRSKANYSEDIWASRNKLRSVLGKKLCPFSLFLEWAWTVIG